MDGRARIVWKLARNHTWGSPIPAEELIRLTTTDEDYDEMREHLEEVCDYSFVARDPDGIYIPNGQDAHVETANWLRKNTEREDFVIASTLSRLPQEWPDIDNDGT
jgi:Asp-tRNA(Asn)/Glu-tRNA(Gln) amidotransferase C subunit